MFKRVPALVIMLTLISASSGRYPVWARTENANAMKVRETVEKLGIDRGARLEVRLPDNTKVKGHISAVDQDSFTVTDGKTGAERRLFYDDVAEVRKSGGGLSTRGWILIGAAAAAVATWIIIKPALCDGGAQTRGPC